MRTVSGQAAKGRRTNVEPQFKRIGVIGSGIIGASWSSLFLAHGLDVIAYDP
jgi:carnitine 3-dehydrogenase